MNCLNCIDFETKRGQKEKKEKETKTRPKIWDF
jgi:hypothetical protein